MASSPPPDPTAAAPLRGIVVLDFTQILAGPFCTQLLADAGATIVKVEPPGGEFSRTRGPRRINDDGEWITSYAASANRGKRSISIDLKHPEGKELVARLAGKADILVENFAPGTLERLGVSYRQLRAERPELVTCSISLFGGFETAGELARRGGLAIVAEAESSISSMQHGDNGSPVKLGMPLGDTTVGLTAYAAIITALVGVKATGVGQHLDISMVKALLAHNATAICGEQIMAPTDSRDYRTAGWGFFPALDGHVAIGVNGDTLFGRLATAIGQGWMNEDPRYAAIAERDLRAEEVDGTIADWTRTRTRGEILDELTGAGVPCGITTTPREILDSEMAASLGLLETVDDTLGGTIQTPAAPHGYGHGRSSIPRADEHGAELLAEILGVDAPEYASLRLAGAFG